MHIFPVNLPALTEKDSKLLQHLACFNAPFYEDDVYLTFLKTEPNQVRFNRMFFELRLRGYVYSLNYLLSSEERNDPMNFESDRYVVSTKGTGQIRTDTENSKAQSSIVSAIAELPT